MRYRSRSRFFEGFEKVYEGGESLKVEENRGKNAYKIEEGEPCSVLWGSGGVVLGRIVVVIVLLGGHTFMRTFV